MLTSSSVFQFKRGDHICIFYRDAATLVETLVPYLVDGLRNGERCFCAQKPEIISRLRLALEARGVDTHQEIRRGALEIHSEDEVYFPDGKFEPQPMMEMLECSVDESLRQGFAGFRTAGEMSWALNGREGCDQLSAYEEMVNASFPQKAAIGICQYPVHGFSPSVLERVIANHRMALQETMISTNHSALSMRCGEYVADIVADRFDPATAFHYVVQKHGAKEVLGWGIEQGMEQAMQTSHAIIDDFASRTQSSSQSFSS
ncbi:MAG TPA: MEDS domain-containing protein [Candidatus Angelobacter sp.]|nr:MEDS domain-containing protein [Candidatus Angelobacter sp.]